MKQQVFLTTFILFAVFASSLIIPNYVQARGIVIYHSGPDMFPAGKFSDEKAKNNELLQVVANDPELLGAQPGYMCETFGLFWTNFFIWDCKPIVMKADTYWDETVMPDVITEVAKLYPESDMQIKFWDHYGRWFFLLGVIAFFAFGYFSPDEEEDEAMQEHNDEDAS